MKTIAKTKRLKLSHKLILGLMLLNLVSTAVFTWYTYQSNKKSFMDAIDGKLVACAQGLKLVADPLNEKVAANGTVPADELMALLDRISVFAREARVNYLYTVIQKEGKILFTSSSYTQEEKEKGDFTKLFDPYEDASDGLKKAFADSRVHFDEYTDKWGSYRSIFVPCRLADGSRYVIGVDVSKAELVSGLRDKLRDCLLIGVIIFIAGSFLMYLVINSITAVIKKLAGDINLVAEGDLSVVIIHAGGDELGQLARDINRMVANLRTVIADVKESASAVAGSSQTFSTTALQIAAGAEEVATQAGAVATAGEEMSATSTEIARNCSTVAQDARAANDSALAGATVVQQTIAGIGRISEQVKLTSSNVAALGSRSEHIGQIIGTIEDIADQTNLLALNAAIEAARAGEQGRGFAVVADEVRALAVRTTRATGEIGGLIKAIQEETREAVAAMENGVCEVARGSEDAEKSRQALNTIIERIGSVSMQVSQIATAAEEQTATTHDISNSIQRMSGVVQQTARGAQDSSRAADGLARLSEELMATVGRFRL